MTARKQLPAAPWAGVNTVMLRACICHHPGLTAEAYAERIGSSREAVSAALQHMARVGSVVCRTGEQSIVWEVVA